MSEDERDREWLRAWCEGDESCGDQLTVAYFDPVRRYFHRRAPDEYEDLVQRTFLKLAQSKANYRGSSSSQDQDQDQGRATVRSFLFGIARNVYLKYLTTLVRDRKIDPFNSSVHQLLGRRPSSLFAAQQEQQALLEVLQEIPVDQQDLVELYYWEELRGPELAVMFKITERALHGHLFRARERLGKLLAERGVVRSDASLDAMLSQTKQLQSQEF